MSRMNLSLPLSWHENNVRIARENHDENVFAVDRDADVSQTKTRVRSIASSSNVTRVVRSA